MKIIYSPLHKDHSPEFEIINRDTIPHAEVPERIEQIVKELKANGFGPMNTYFETKLS